MIALDPDYLRSFLAICDTGSYGAAAERVSKTQSTLSAQMKRLEEQLQVGLFEKAGRRNALTPDGFRLLEYAKSIVKLNAEAVNAFRPATAAGTVRIGVSDDYAQAFLLPALSKFTARHPQVELEIVTADSRALRAREDVASFDALIVSTNSGIEGLEVLRTDRMHWIGPAAGRVHLGERLPLALWGDGCSWRAMGLAALAQADRPYRVVHTTSNAPLLRGVVREGLAVTIGPEWYLSDGLVVLADLDRVCPLGTDGLGIKVLADAAGGPLESFLDFARAAFRGAGRFLG